MMAAFTCRRFILPKLSHVCYNMSYKGIYKDNKGGKSNGYKYTGKDKTGHETR